MWSVLSKLVAGTTSHGASCKHACTLGSHCTTLPVVKCISLLRSETKGPLVTPCRGMRGVKSVVLHKEVIEQYRLKKLKELEQKERMVRSTQAGQFLPIGQLSQLLPDDKDLPVSGLQNPYAKPAAKCLLCVHDVELDYKNTQLLSQFVSPHTGRIYGRQVTGLCLFMQRRIARLIKRSRYFGFMPYELKNPNFLKDPKLFDPFKRK